MSETKKNKPERIEYLDLLAVISAISVVYLHVNGCFWQFSATEVYWLQANIIEGICYFSVPMFFMISGANLIDYPKYYDTKTFFRKRFEKTVIPFLVWSIIGILYRIYYLKDLNPADISVKWIIQGINNTSIVASLFWFFPAIFSVYLAVPVLAVIPDNHKKNTYTYIVLMGFLFNYLFPFIANLSGFNRPSVKMPIGLNYILYVVLGYLFCHFDISKKIRTVYYILGEGSVILLIIGTYTLSIRNGKIVDTFRGYENVPILLITISIFLFAKYNYHRLFQFDITQKLVNILKNYTFAIYLTHWFVYRSISKEFFIDNKNLTYRLLAPILVCIICCLISWIIRKIPLLKKIIP